MFCCFKVWGGIFIKYKCVCYFVNGYMRVDFLNEFKNFWLIESLLKIVDGKW